MGGGGKEERLLLMSKRAGWRETELSQSPKESGGKKQEISIPNTFKKDDHLEEGGKDGTSSHSSDSGP